MNSSINVYIDGACSNNGKPNAIAGYGVFFEDNDIRNESKRVIGKQSNNTGELTAFIRSLEILEKDILENKTIHVYTDSEYVMKCVSSYGAKLERNDWKTSNDKIPPNLKLLQKAYNLFKGKQNIKLHYIQAHSGKDNVHSKGNEAADRLARMSIGHVDNERPQKVDNEIVLDWVTFSNKDKAKSIGAKWNVNKKYWYVPENTSLDIIEKLEALSKEPCEEVKVDSNSMQKTYIKVSFAKKDKAKSLGARWDPSVKSWYYTQDLAEEKQKALKNI
jgi:ribonuclease HI